MSPNEVSYSSSAAWKDIYGHRKGGVPTFAKDPKFYRNPASEDVVDIINASDEDHSELRRIFANAFSDRALKMQEPLFLTYVDKLIAHLQGLVSKNPATIVNIVNLFNFTTFDIMGDLAFGEPLDMLDNSGYHPWVAAILANFRFGTYLHCIRYFPMLEAVLLKIIPPSVKAQQALHNSFAHARVDRRLGMKEKRSDIWGLVLEHQNGERPLTRRQMYANANLFMIAGTETTATLLSGLTFHLLSNMDVLDKLKWEIRSTFGKEDDITIERLQRLPYLHCCVEEALRMYPPVSNGLPRLIPPTGAVIDGCNMPGGVCMSRICRDGAQGLTASRLGYSQRRLHPTAIIVISVLQMSSYPSVGRPTM